MCLGHGLEMMLLRDEIAEELLDEDGEDRSSFERPAADAASEPPSFANERRETDVELLTDEG
jgi:hypothetical protein